MVNMISSWRKKRELSQEQLAAEIGSYQANICQYEIGIKTPNVRTALKIARALGCGLDDLFYEKGEENVYNG